MRKKIVVTLFVGLILVVGVSLLRVELFPSEVRAQDASLAGVSTATYLTAAGPIYVEAGEVFKLRLRGEPLVVNVGHGEQTHHFEELIRFYNGQAGDFFQEIVTNESSERSSYFPGMSQMVAEVGSTEY